MVGLCSLSLSPLWTCFCRMHHSICAGISIIPFFLSVLFHHYRTVPSSLPIPYSILPTQNHTQNLKFILRTLSLSLSLSDMFTTPPLPDCYYICQLANALIIPFLYFLSLSLFHAVNLINSRLIIFRVNKPKHCLLRMQHALNLEHLHYTYTFHQQCTYVYVWDKEMNKVRIYIVGGRGVGLIFYVLLSPGQAQAREISYLFIH